LKGHVNFKLYFREIKMNNVNGLKIAVLSVAILGATSGVANAAKTTAKSHLEIVQAFTIKKSDDLEFGRIFVPAKKGTLTISTKGAPKVTGGVISPTGKTHPAAFSLSGKAKQSYTITLPRKTTISNGKTKLTVSKYTHSAGKSPKLDKKGAGAFKVGATIAIPAKAKTGNYTGVFTVSTDY
jgi:hypothetical protein